MEIIELKAGCTAVETKHIIMPEINEEHCVQIDNTLF
jgi:hypothetical protein